MAMLKYQRVPTNRTEDFGIAAHLWVSPPQRVLWSPVGRPEISIGSFRESMVETKHIWFIYGHYMVIIWLVYGSSMDNLWIYNLWIIYGYRWWLSHPSEQYESQLGWWFPTYGNIENVPNHQPAKHICVQHKLLCFEHGFSEWRPRNLHVSHNLVSGLHVSKFDQQATEPIHTNIIRITSVTAFSNLGKAAICPTQKETRGLKELDHPNGKNHMHCIKLSIKRLTQSAHPSTSVDFTTSNAVTIDGGFLN